MPDSPYSPRSSSHQIRVRACGERRFLQCRQGGLVPPACLRGGCRILINGDFHASMFHFIPCSAYASNLEHIPTVVLTNSTEVITDWLFEAPTTKYRSGALAARPGRRERVRRCGVTLPEFPPDDQPATSADTRSGATQSCTRCVQSSVAPYVWTKVNQFGNWTFAADLMHRPIFGGASSRSDVVVISVLDEDNTKSEKIWGSLVHIVLWPMKRIAAIYSTSLKPAGVIRRDPKQGLLLRILLWRPPLRPPLQP